MRKNQFLLIVLLCSAIGVYGQNLSNYERRRMNDKLFDLLISYENYASFTESHMQYSFLDLFLSSEALVYCDLIASNNFGKLIPVSEYVNYSSKEVSVRYVEIRNLQKADYRLENGQYVVSVEFDKSIEYEDELGTVFMTDDPLIGSYHISMECVFDKETDSFYIAEVSGVANESCTFPSDQFLIVEHKDPRDFLLTVNGVPLHFNLFGEAVVDGTNPPMPLLEDEDLIVTTNTVGTTDRYIKINHSYKETKLRFRIGASFAPISAYNVVSPVKFLTMKSSAYEVNFDFGYAFSLTAKSKLAIFAGLGVSYSTLILGVSDIAYSYELSDRYGMAYTREYQLSSVKEGFSFVDVVLPVYLSYESMLGNRLALSVDAGVKLYLNTSTIIDPYTVKGTSSFADGGSVQTVTDLTGTIDQYMVPASYARNTYDLAVFGKVGLEYKLKRGKYLFAKVGYIYGLTESYNSNLSQWYNEQESIYPFVYSDRSDSDVAVRSFADCISYRRSAITLDLGFRMKF